ncbi:MAG: hypothetical protein ACJ8NR_04710 [Sulfurifustis sp.]
MTVLIRRASFVYVVAFLAALAGSMIAWGQDGRDSAKPGAVAKQDVYLAGGVVEPAVVDGDLVAAGGQIHIDNDVTGDAMLAGGHITLRARVGDDVRVAGGNVSLNGTIGDDAIAAGGLVVIGSAAAVGGRAWLAGGTVEMHGKVRKGLRVAARRIIIDGDVTGDADLVADTIEINPGATIGGNLRYRSPNEALIAGGVKIGGTITHEPTTGVGGRERMTPAALIARGAFYIGLILAGIVLYLLFPVASVGAAHTIAESPWKSLGLGFALLATTPLVIALLFATIFGLWLALVALLLYFILLFIGFLAGVLYVGEAGLVLLGKTADAPMGWHVLAIIIAFAVLWVARHIPVLGGVFVFALLVLGLGALVLYLARRYAGHV